MTETNPFEGMDLSDCSLDEFFKLTHDQIDSFEKALKKLRRTVHLTQRLAEQRQLIGEEKK